MTLVIFVLFYLILFVLGALVAWVHTGGIVDDFAKLFTPYVAALTSLLAALIAYLNVNRQTKLTKQVEKLKADLTVDIEATKTALAAASNAYTELSRALNAFYHSIVKVEEKAFNPDVSKTCDEDIEKVVYQLDRLDESCEAPYRGAWHELHVVRERCAAAASDDDRLKHWLAGKASIATALNEFQVNFKYHPLPRTSQSPRRLGPA
ncbi:hypothetical protein [Paraburkholderia tuberum]|uniref:Uncharacterized protein n=1 Tax=Paraburkholderia tuberum TaxID=157910 RepID=A0A1H1AAY1_9BURK|nr:hypothetical protein [Paraburkholderia tuberum]SDQ36436.1 hypothetical protein SAMN05445850_0404 [Paraburkholderia tuberum]